MYWPPGQTTFVETPLHLLAERPYMWSAGQNPVLERIGSRHVDLMLSAVPKDMWGAAVTLRRGDTSRSSVLVSAAVGGDARVLMSLLRRSGLPSLNRISRLFRDVCYQLKRLQSLQVEDEYGGDDGTNKREVGGRPTERSAHDEFQLDLAEQIGEVLRHAAHLYGDEEANGDVDKRGQAFAERWDNVHAASGDNFVWNEQCGALTEVAVGRCSAKRGQYFLDVASMPHTALASGDEVQVGGMHKLDNVYVVDVIEEVFEDDRMRNSRSEEFPPVRIVLTTPYRGGNVEDADLMKVTAVLSDTLKALSQMMPELPFAFHFKQYAFFCDLGILETDTNADSGDHSPPTMVSVSALTAWFCHNTSTFELRRRQARLDYLRRDHRHRSGNTQSKGGGSKGDSNGARRPYLDLGPLARKTQARRVLQYITGMPCTGEGYGILNVEETTVQIPYGTFAYWLNFSTATEMDGGALSELEALWTHVDYEFKRLSEHRYWRRLQENLRGHQKVQERSLAHIAAEAHNPESLQVLVASGGQMGDFSASWVDEFLRTPLHLAAVAPRPILESDRDNKHKGAGAAAAASAAAAAASTLPGAGGGGGASSLSSELEFSSSSFAAAAATAAEETNEALSTASETKDGIIDRTPPPVCVALQGQKRCWRRANVIFEGCNHLSMCHVCAARELNGGQQGVKCSVASCQNLALTASVVRFAQAECVAMLLAAGVDCTMVDASGRTALLNACIFPSDPSVLRLLLIHGANPTDRDEALVRELFEALDKDGNNSISKDELHEFIFDDGAAADTSVGSGASTIRMLFAKRFRTAEDIEECFDEMETNANGELEYDQVQSILENISNADCNGNGKGKGKGKGTGRAGKNGRRGAETGVSSTSLMTGLHYACWNASMASIALLMWWNVGGACIQEEDGAGGEDCGCLWCSVDATGNPPESYIHHPVVKALYEETRSVVKALLRLDQRRAPVSSSSSRRRKGGQKSGGGRKNSPERELEAKSGGITGEAAGAAAGAAAGVGVRFASAEETLRIEPEEADLMWLQELRQQRGAAARPEEMAGSLSHTVSAASYEHIARCLLDTPPDAAGAEGGAVTSYLLDAVEAYVPGVETAQLDHIAAVLGVAMMGSSSSASSSRPSSRPSSPSSDSSSSSSPSSSSASSALPRGVAKPCLANLLQLLSRPQLGPQCAFQLNASSVFHGIVLNADTEAAVLSPDHHVQFTAGVNLSQTHEPWSSHIQRINQSRAVAGRRPEDPFARRLVGQIDLTEEHVAAAKPVQVVTDMAIVVGRLFAGRVSSVNNDGTVDVVVYNRPIGTNPRLVEVDLAEGAPATSSVRRVPRKQIRRARPATSREMLRWDKLKNAAKEAKEAKEERDEGNDADPITPRLSSRRSFGKTSPTSPRGGSSRGGDSPRPSASGVGFNRVASVGVQGGGSMKPGRDRSTSQMQSSRSRMGGFMQGRTSSRGNLFGGMSSPEGGGKSTDGFMGSRGGGGGGGDEDEEGTGEGKMSAAREAARRDRMRESMGASGGFSSAGMAHYTAGEAWHSYVHELQRHDDVEVALVALADAREDREKEIASGLSGKGKLGGLLSGGQESEWRVVRYYHPTTAEHRDASEVVETTSRTEGMSMHPRNEPCDLGHLPEAIGINNQTADPRGHRTAPTAATGAGSGGSLGSVKGVADSSMCGMITPTEEKGDSVPPIFLYVQYTDRQQSPQAAAVALDDSDSDDGNGDGDDDGDGDGMKAKKKKKKKKKKQQKKDKLRRAQRVAQEAFDAREAVTEIVRLNIFA